MKYLGAYVENEDIATKVKVGSGSITAATGAEINTGTDNTKMATPKAIADSNIVASADGTVSNIIALTKAQYDALTPAQKAGNTYMTTDEVEAELAVATPTSDGLMSMADKGAMNALSTAPVTIVNSSVSTVIDDYITMDADWTCDGLTIIRWGALIYFYANLDRAVTIGPGNITNDVIFTWTTLGLKYAPISGHSISTLTSGAVANGYINSAGAGVCATDLAIGAWNFALTYMRNSIYDD